MAEECKYHADHKTKIDRNERDIQTLYEAVEKIKNRLPNWATALIAILTATIGWLAATKITGV